MEDISEFKMAIAFEKLLKSSKKIKGIPDFELLYKEVVCQQGIADFVGIDSNHTIDDLEVFDNISSLESGTLIYSLLKPKAPRSKQYLCEKTGLTNKTVSRVVKELCQCGVIMEVKNNQYILGSEMKVPQLNIWAFELKLSNWKRALFQALQYKAFANYVLVVFPFEKESVLKRQLEIFRELNVGILLFDISLMKCKFLLHPHKERASSKWHMLFALGQLLQQHSCEERLR